MTIEFDLLHDLSKSRGIIFGNPKKAVSHSVSESAMRSHHIEWKAEKREMRYLLTYAWRHACAGF